MKTVGAVIPLAFWVALTVTALLFSAFPPRLPGKGEARDKLAIQAARRVAIYPPLVAAYLTVDDTAGNILAVSEGDRLDVARGLFGQMFPPLRHVLNLAMLGGRSAVPGDPEQVLLLAPDRVIVWAWARGGLENIGVPLEPIASTDLSETWRRIGQIAEKPERVDDLIASFRKSQHELVETVDRLQVRKGRRVLIVWRNGANVWNVAGDGNRQAQYLKEIGAADPPVWFPKKPASIGSASVNVEVLLKLDPEVVFLPCCRALNDDPATFYAEPSLQPLTAVQERRVYKEPSGAARMDGIVEWPLLLRWCAELLYPTKLGSNFRDDFRHAYAKTFGVLVSDKDLDDMLFLRENSMSADYSRFARLDVQRTNVEP